MEQAERSQLRVGVVGVGPVGTTLAAHLIKAGAYVVPCDIDRNRIDAIASDGIRLENKIELAVPVSRVCYSVAELEQHDLDLIAIAVKTPALTQVVSQIADFRDNRVTVMCTQNGLDNEQEAARLLGPDRTLRMVVNYAGGMSAPNTVDVIFFNPPNYIAALSRAGEPLAQRVVALLNSAELITTVPDNIQDYIWAKAILNAALSPVCAITRQTMGDVMEFPPGLALVKEILEESMQVAKAAGITLADGFMDFSIKYLKSGGYHKPSMLVDLENGLLTEIDYLNERIAEVGLEHGVPVPINQAITALVHLQERRSK